MSNHTILIHPYISPTQKQLAFVVNSTSHFTFSSTSRCVCVFGYFHFVWNPLDAIICERIYLFPLQRGGKEFLTSTSARSSTMALYTNDLCNCPQIWSRRGIWSKESCDMMPPSACIHVARVVGVSRNVGRLLWRTIFGWAQCQFHKIHTCSAGG